MSSNSGLERKWVSSATCTRGRERERERERERGLFKRWSLKKGLGGLSNVMEKQEFLTMTKYY